jgi:hypothetical protein
MRRGRGRGVDAVDAYTWGIANVRSDMMSSFDHNNKKIEEIDLDTSCGLWECMLRVLWPTGCYGLDNGTVFSVGCFFTYDKENWSQLMELITEETVRGSIDFMKTTRGPEIIERYMSMRFLYL